MSDDPTKLLEELIQDFSRRAQLYGCDAVQVLVSMHSEPKEETFVYKFGRGNWYARQGMAREFLEEDEARTVELVKIREFGDEDE